ncbi:hypothetical protein FOZ60_000946 [Perkinsus olseni]|uniref:Uncharacterized protein n=1 Tax=Perkinsus olseni TaxID=32597 RepID=A0A7J6P2I3_PEROL|nr:hypothetical protein FOZ60_000946 [Perkinsus olseni]
MLFPPHVGALRCQMVEGLWKESAPVGPLPELMIDIMAYISKPILTLGCPMEEIILDINSEPELVFAKGGVVYGVFKCASSIALQQIYPLGQKVTLVSHLTVQHYDVEASNVHATWELPKLFSGGMQPSHMVVIGNELFVAVSREYRMEVRCTKLDEIGDIEVLWAKARSDDSSHIYCLNPVSARPLSMNILYHEVLHYLLGYVGEG